MYVSFLFHLTRSVAFMCLINSHPRQPDLPVRLQKDIPLTPYNREVFYIEGSPVGYNDYVPADTSISVAG
jgi:hypothetical protein